MDSTLINALRDLLQRESGQPVALVQTHISWVLLTASHAYKLKKPVHLPFVDFSSVVARKHFCEEELRLNQRFAPALYVDVVPFCGTPTSPCIGGTDAPIDHLVRMRRFPDGALLHELLVSGSPAPALIEGLGRRLAAWQATAERADPAAEHGSPAQILRAATDVVSRLTQQRWPAAEQEVWLAALNLWVRERGAALRSDWAQRQQSGAVRECHGDLHTGNVVLIDGELTAFDCIEFDTALRWIDVINDVAFLTMDLKAHGRADLASRFLDAWIEHSGDHAGLPVLRFYEVYRALVRALASRLAERMDAALDYLRCAQQLAQAPESGARLLITHGLSGSGKSTIAAQLLAETGAVRVRSDVERKRLFGLAPLDRSAAAGLAIYGEDATRQTFARLHECAREALLAGYPVIVDAAFLRAAERRQFEDLAGELGLPFAILDCQADVQILRRRVAERQAAGSDASEAGPAVLEMQLERHEPLNEHEQALAIVVRTDDKVDIPALAARWRGVRPAPASASGAACEG